MPKAYILILRTSRLYRLPFPRDADTLAIFSEPARTPHPIRNFHFFQSAGDTALHSLFGCYHASMREAFRKFARKTSSIAGTPWAFMFSILIILAWILTGPFFNFSDTWQLVINTGTTIITFLMVFLIQNTQNRDSHAMHLKLDELLKSIEGARNQLIDIEDSSEEALTELQKEYHVLKSSDGPR